MKRCKDCTEWFSYKNSAFNGMSFEKSGHCLLPKSRPCNNKEYYVRKWWKVWRPK